MSRADLVILKEWLEENVLKGNIHQSVTLWSSSFGHEETGWRVMILSRLSGYQQQNDSTSVSPSLNMGHFESSSKSTNIYKNR